MHICTKDWGWIGNNCFCPDCIYKLRNQQRTFEENMNKDKKIAELEARIKELEAQKPKDNSEYEFEINSIYNQHTFLKGKAAESCYIMRIEENTVFLNEYRIRIIINTLQKVINDKVLR